MRNALVATLSLSLLFGADAATALQVDPVAGQPLDPNYQQQAERERQDQQRQEEEERDRQMQERLQGRVDDACGIAGCGDYEGLQSRALAGTGLVAVLHRIERDDDELTVRLRFYNEGDAAVRLSVDPGGEHPFLLLVGEEELAILADDDGELEAKKPLDVELDPGEMETWYATFPAPATGTRRIDLAIPPFPTFEQIELE